MKQNLLLLFAIFTLSAANAQNPQGFFLNDMAPRSVSAPAFDEVTKPTKSVTATVNVDFTNVLTPVSKYIFGNNANAFMTQMVDQPDLINNIKTLSPNVLRFPGGNLSSLYFWNADKNQPPADAPAKILDSNGAQIDPGYWYGRNSDSWTMSVDNYYQMLQQTNSTGIITLNYGYARYSTGANPVAAAAHLAADWVRYDNGRTKFWEIGNESNGTWQAGYRISTANNKDGQPEIITGALYGKHVKVFIDSMRKAANEKGVTIYIGAQLLQEAPATWWNNTDKGWNAGVFQEAGNAPDFYIIHSYYTPYQANSTAADILSSATTVTKTMMDYVRGAVAQAGLSVKPIALTEWNIFAQGSKQQASYINGMHAAIALGEFIKNKYGFASRWDLANAWDNGNDHGMFSQGDEPGVPKWNPRAVFYYMYYFQRYTGDHALNTVVNGSSDIIAYASQFSSGQTGVVLINKGTAEQTVGINIQNFGYGERYYWHTLTGGSDNGEFSLKVFVNGNGPSFSSGGPSNVEAIKARSARSSGGVKITAPARSVQYILIDNGDNTITGTEETKALQVEIFPNPAHPYFNVVLPSTGFTKIEILNQQGNRLYEHDLTPSESTHQVKMTLPSGVYIVRLHKSSEAIHRKIVIE